jgi:hypothetical protein
MLGRIMTALETANDHDKREMALAISARLTKLAPNIPQQNETVNKFVSFVHVFQIIVHGLIGKH